MKDKSVILCLQPNRIMVILTEGGVVAEHRERPVSLDLAEKAFVTSLRALRPEFTDLVKDMDVAGNRCVIYYHSPTSTTQMVSAPTRNVRTGISAASLALSDALPYSVDIAVTSVACVARDLSGNAIHMLAAADRTEMTVAVASLADDLGVKLNAVVPLDVPIYSSLINSSLKSATENPLGMLYLGWHSSAMSVVHEGKLLLFRILGFSLEQLISTVARSVQSAPGLSDNDLSAELAHDWLLKYGIPEPDQIIDDAHNITGATLRPLMQPILQRLVTEIRQSLRFGVSDEIRGSVKLQLQGTGAILPNLAETLGFELGLKVSIDDQENSTGQEVINDPEIQLCIHDSSQPAINLLPAEIRCSCDADAFRRKLWIGTIAACLLVVLNAFMLHMKITDARETVKPLEATVAQMRELQSKQKSLQAAVRAANIMENTVMHELSVSPPLPALLKAMSLETPDKIRLMNIAFRITEDGPVANVDGYALTTDRSRASEIIRGYVETLKSLPPVKEVVLASVQKTHVDVGDAQQFRLNMYLYPLPAFLSHGKAATVAVTPENETQP